MSCQQATRFITNTNCKNVVTAKNNINIINCSSNNNNNNSISYSNNNNNIFIKSKQFSNILQPEDPYVFTESVPTTPPPILFNAQKSRTRLNDTTITITKINTQQQQQQQQKPQTAAATSPVNSAAVVVTVSKHQQTPSTTTTTLSSPAPTSPASQPTIKNVNNKKITATLVKTQASLQTTAAGNANRQNVTQSLKKIATQIVATSNVNKKLSNVCIVRPQLQQTQQQQPYHHYPHSNYITSIDDDDDGGQLKTAVSLSSSSSSLSSSPPPPLYTPPTPSLWQTPLLLDDCIKKESILIKNNAFLHVAPLTSAADSAIAGVASNCNNNSTTTAMAKVAPIVVHASPPTNQQQLQQCLPPSKFHNHTLAQHLQKLECLKKSKAQNQENILSQETSTLNNDLKSNLSIIPPTHTATTVTSSSSPPSAATLAQCDTIATIKHSETEDLIEIPVNVIYRTTLDSQPPPPPLALQSSCDKKSNNDRQPLTNANCENSIRSSKFIKKSPILEPIKSKNLHANNKTNKSDLATVPTTNSVTATITAAAKTNPSSIQQIKSFSGNDSVTIPNNITNILENSNGNHQPSLHKRSLNVMTTTTQSRATTTTSATVGTNKRKSITAAQCQGTAASSSLEHPAWQMATTTTKGAVAIVKMSPNDLDADISHLATISGLPYCLQYQWLKPLDYLKPFAGKIKEDKVSLPREERIRLYKQQLHRQAVQFLSIRSLQKLPLQVARKRLISVDRLLRKYKENHLNLKLSPPAHLKRCIAADCNHSAIQMADHCQRHIIANETQHIFAPCTAKFADNTQCRMPVFSVITHDMPLCPEHARKRDAYNRLVYEQRPRKMNTLVTKPQQQQQHQQQHQHQQQQHQQHLTIIPTTMTMKNETKQYVMMSQQKSQLTTSRKRKNATIDASGNPVGRPVQKRYKKSMETSQPSQHNNAIASIATMRLPATQLKRKASTTSLESITSNSQHSSASSTLDSNNVSNSTSQQLFNIISNSSLNCSVTTHNKSTLPPALAPLSGFVPNHMLSFGHDNYNKQQQQQQHSQPQQYCAVNNRNNANNNNSNISKNNSNPKISIDLKDFMSSQFVQQYRNSTDQQQQHHHHQQPTNNVNTSAANSSDVNFLNTNSNSNFTGTSGMGSTTSLHTSVADDFLTQDMLSICENSSASSVDTGLGGLSDPELMLGGADDDMPLGDTHLLEEHDLANVLNSLPEDAFQELFTAVHQEESDEIERAIELADKHLKKLQQTIGSELGDFLDFSDDMLLDNGVGGCSEADIDGICSMSPTANSMMDTRNLFMSGGGLGGNASAVVAASIANS